MAALAAIVLAPLLLEYDDLGPARLLYDFRVHRGTLDEWPSDDGAFAANRQHLGERDLCADIADEAFDGDLVACSDAVLLSASLYDCKHDEIRTTLIIGLSQPCQRMPMVTESKRGTSIVLPVAPADFTTSTENDRFKAQ